jgi:hypothetical protein
MKLRFRPESSGHYVAKLTRQSIAEFAKSEFSRTGQIYFFNGQNSAWATVIENEAKFRSDQVKRARQVKDLIRKLSYPSTQMLCKMLRSGGISNCELTPEDVANSIEHHFRK